MIKTPVEKLLISCGKTVDEKSLAKVCLKFGDSLDETVSKHLPNYILSLSKTILSVCIFISGIALINACVCMKSCYAFAMLTTTTTIYNKAFTCYIEVSKLNENEA